jgi:hypothetical protein
MSFAWNNRGTIAATLCSAALALGIASCGGKSGASSAKATAPVRGASGPTTGAARSPLATVSAKQFIEQADEICGRANAAIARSEGKATGKLRKPDAHAAVVAQNQEYEEKAIKELSKLKPPSALAGAWQKMSLYRQALARELGVFATATHLRVSNLGQLVASKKKLHFQLRAAGRKAGFKDCATVG